MRNLRPNMREAEKIKQNFFREIFLYLAIVAFLFLVFARTNESYVAKIRER